MGLISVRLDDEDERFIRKHGLSMSEVVREAVHARLQAMRAGEHIRFLESIRWTPDEPATKTIRRLRDGRPLRA